MLKLFHKKSKKQNCPLNAGIQSQQHKLGVLVCGGMGSGSSVACQVVANEILNTKPATKLFATCQSKEDFQYLIDKRKMACFTIKEELLDFNLTPMTLNSLNVEKIKAYVLLILQTLGIKDKEKVLLNVLEDVDYFNFFDMDLLYKRLCDLPDFSKYTWDYLLRKPQNGLNVFDGLAEKLSKNDAVFVEIDAFNVNAISYALINFIKLQHNTVLMVIDSNQPIDEIALKSAYSQEAVIVKKSNPTPTEVNWFNMLALPKVPHPGFEGILSPDLNILPGNEGALYYKESKNFVPISWKKLWSSKVSQP